LQADGNAELALAMGVEMDLTGKSLGIRSRRYSMLLDDLEVSLHNDACMLEQHMIALRPQLLARCSALWK
jgi:peroxiredoxin